MLNRKKSKLNEKENFHRNLDDFVFLSIRFVSLLEFAEDKLHCKHVIVYFDKARSDRASLVKTFMFLGFHVLSPENRLMKKEDKIDDQIFMLYQIDD